MCAIAIRPTETTHSERVLDTRGLPVRSWAQSRTDAEMHWRRSGRRRLQRVRRVHGVGGHQLQAYSELAQIPTGTIVVPLVVRSPKRLLRSDPDLFLGLGLGIKPFPGRLGKPFRWKSENVGYARYSRWIFFDPGDALLERIRQERTMRVTPYQAINARGLLVEPSAPEADVANSWIRFEAGPAGYGAAWPTTWGASKAINLALDVLQPSAQDETTVVTREGRRTIPTSQVLSELKDVEPVFVSAVIGQAVLNWTESGNDPRRPGSRELDFGGDHYEANIARRLISRTFLGSNAFVRDALEQADGILHDV